MNWFRRSTLRTKVLITVMTGIFSLLIIVVTNFVNLNNILKYYNHILTINIKHADELGDMRQHVAMLGVHLNELFIDFERGEYTAKQFSEIDYEIKEYNSVDKAFNEVEFMPGEATLYKMVANDWKKNVEQIKYIREVFLTKDKSNKEKLAKLVEETVISLDHNLTALMKLDDFQDQEVKKWSQSAVSEASLGQIIILSSGGFFIILSLSIGYFISNYLTNKFNLLASELNTGADEVAGASHSVSSTAQELSQATTEQAASLEETAASIEEMASMVKMNSDNSIGAVTLASQSHTSAKNGEDVVKMMVVSMNAINDSNQNIMDAISESNREISEITKVITEIGNKTKVINDIVFQTKLLSFNASVEAARAGEHGRGFAVVAEEVGNLAQMSGNAAKEISSMLEGSIQKVESIVRNTQTRVEHLVKEGHSKVEQGSNIAKQCGEVLSEIVESVGKVTSMAEEISVATNEQSKGVSEISKAMNQLDHVTQQNAQTSDASANAAEQLSAQATNMRSIVVKLTEEIQGQNTQLKNQVLTKEITQSTKSNVVHLNTKKHKEVPSHHTIPHKAVSGSGLVTQTPSADDKRFEEV